MCGFAGFITTKSCSAENLESCAVAMNKTIALRGPDDSGVWVDPESKIAMGHRRLSIIDLSQTGHQPMESPSGRYIVVYNGEIYNYKILESALKKQGYFFRGHCDTEVMLTAIEAWGIETALKSFSGMFAFALWDKKERSLTLARDRIGEKPLYYGWQKGTFLFGSELKALKAHHDWAGEIDSYALALYMRYNYIPAPYSIYKNICKLLPGTWLKMKLPLLPGMLSAEPEPYWQAGKVAEYGVSNPLSLSDDEAVDSLDKLLMQSVREKMMSDVPLGAFLSGGIDSSVVVALMQQESARPVKTFTIGFHEQAYNEAEDARAVAEHLKTEHTEMYINSRQARDVIPRLPGLYDEPFSDSSQIPVFLISEMTKQHVTVALSGDGGDELFGGYNRHVWAPEIWNRIKCRPLALRRILSALMNCLSPGAWDIVSAKISSLSRGRIDHRMSGYKIQRLAEILPASSPAEIYDLLISHWKKPPVLMQEHYMSGRTETGLTCKSVTDNFQHYMMLMDLITYLPDDILTKLDRASMGVSLEARVPMLDHRIVEFAWRLPLSMKIRNGRGKWILRQVLNRYVPKKLTNRPKIGFGIPIDSWLRGPLRDWTENLLDESKLRQDGFFDPEPILRKWKEHLSGKRNWAYHLWDVLIFQEWLGKNG